eukprot:CAMPEP_0195515804 /NCGR_PEP_ID=MMETSP0794_2-20130614/6746_1 /TAXON_ID=515487 /ORGANISM="Stephanopyxis turris, Strain CCMP 815" /LENGTH=97 /DNA_ID=CAMNT_0040644287 /DNA_START=69 /DNA_END=365 /DNA_ORIENTATION=-
MNLFCCLLVRLVATACNGSSGQGCLAYLPLISVRMVGYVSFQKNGKSMVRANNFPDGDKSESDMGIQLFLGPMVGESISPKNCWSLADAVGGVSSSP